MLSRLALAVTFSLATLTVSAYAEDAPAPVATTTAYVAALDFANLPYGDQEFPDARKAMMRNSFHFITPGS